MPSIYQLKITLKHSQPSIWRRIQLSPASSFKDLHEVIQTTMGWGNGHLHQFCTKKEHGMYIGGCITDTTIEDIEPFEDAADERDVELQARLTKVGMRCSYEYDFGDSWEHDVLLEKIVSTQPGVNYPICIAGRRQCPPEDCGGVGGYYHLLDILADAKHKEHKDMLEWLCIEHAEDFDPDAFDCDEINDTLHSL